ncbi:HNH endonuclease [Nocardia africana]
MSKPVKISPRRRADISPGVRRRVYERDDWTCQYCGRRIEPATPNQANGRNAPVDMSSGKPVWLELDHKTPRALGGNNSFDNLRAACSPCNRRKSDSTQAVDWELRAARAMEILTTRPANQGSVLAAARALLGVTPSLESGDEFVIEGVS